MKSAVTALTLAVSLALAGGCDDETVPAVVPPDAALPDAHHPDVLKDVGQLPDAADPTDDQVEQRRLFGAREIVPVEITLSDLSYNQLVAEPRRDYVPAAITIDGRHFPRVGLKLKGGRGSFRKITQKAAFKIDLDRYDPDANLHGLRKLTINNMIQDVTKMRERMASLMFTEFGLPAPRVGYAEVHVNGRLYGLHSLVETLDEPFLRRVFPELGDDPGIVYEGADDADFWLRDLALFDLDVGKDPDQRALGDLVRAIDRATPLTIEEELGVTVDLELVRKFFAAEILTGHWDGYAQLRNNYYVYQRPTDGRWLMLPWGTDQTFQRTRDAFAGPGRLFRMCMDWLPCRLPYVETVWALADRMERRDWNAEIDILEALTEDAFQRDPRTPTKPEQRTAGIPALRDFIATHPARIRNSIRCTDLADDLDGDGVAGCSGDCNDRDPEIYPGAVDTCDDDVDQDCTGFTDDGQTCPECRATTDPMGTTFLLCHRPERINPARETCADHGGYIASVLNAAEQDFVTAAALDRRSTRWWLGLIDFREEGRYEWLDDQVVDFTAWATGEPNNNGGYEDCVCFGAGGLPAWNDVYCGTYLPTVCRLP